MSHSVARHLRIAVDEYDRTIRAFIPGYDGMLDAVADAVASAGALDRVLDLGAGTGAASFRLLERMPTATIELWDIDPDMLNQARIRLAHLAPRARFHAGSFYDPLPPADAVMASLALHHVRDIPAKQALYGRIAGALGPGGAFVNADVTMPEDAEEARPSYRYWADHMAGSGIDEESAFAHFAQWATLDRYLPLEVELGLLREAGLEPTVAFQAGPVSVTVGRKPARVDDRRGAP